MLSIRRARMLLLPMLAAPAFVTPLAAQQSPLGERIQRVMNRPEFAHAMWGIQFASLDSGRVVYALNENKLFTPGSTTKLLTEGTVMGVLGADHRPTDPRLSNGAGARGRDRIDIFGGQS